MSNFAHILEFPTKSSDTTCYGNEACERIGSWQLELKRSKRAKEITHKDLRGKLLLNVRGKIIGR